MSKNNKMIARLLSKPKDLTWEELIKILGVYGYKEMKKGKTSGARRKFADAQKNIIALHQPHPGNIVKGYAIKEVTIHFKEKGWIKDE